MSLYGLILHTYSMIPSGSWAYDSSNRTPPLFPVSHHPQTSLVWTNIICLNLTALQYINKRYYFHLFVFLICRIKDCKLFKDRNLLFWSLMFILASNSIFNELRTAMSTLLLITLYKLLSDTACTRFTCNDLAIALHHWECNYYYIKWM